MATILAPLAPLTTCAHESSVATPVGADTIASAWECDDCAHLTPFTAADYAFCNTDAWTPRAPEGVSRLTWLLTSREAKFAIVAPVARV